MGFKHCLQLTMCLFCFEVISVDSKTVQGVFSSMQAQNELGQYVTTFCFHGENAEFQYQLNATGSTPGHLYFFMDEDWLEAKDTMNCRNKLDMARFSHTLSNETGNHTVAHFIHPRIWHIVYADAYTCDKKRPIKPLELANFIDYKLVLLNPDSLNNPTEHFSDEETGLLRFYQLLTLAYFVLACIYTPRLYEALSKQGPMHLVIQLLTTAMGLQAGGAFLMMVHLQRYSKDGLGSPLFELLAEFVDVISQFVMLYMLLSLSLGWTLGSSHKPTPLDALKKRPAAQVVGVLGLIQGILFLWEQYEEREHMMYHAHRSNVGIMLVVLRLVLAAIFASNLYSTVSRERSALKREFYSSFAKSCTLWFLCYPTLVITSWMFSAYLRYKLITMGIVMCQSIAVVRLYKLFLSRSLYWEVSALSNTLPIRMDKSFGIRLYS